MPNSFDNRLKEKDNESVNPFQKINEAKMNIRDTVSKNKEYIGDILFGIIWGLITLTMIGLLDLIDPNFDYENYKTVYFWIEYITLQGALWSIRVLMKQLGDKKEFRTNVGYIKLQNDLNKFVEKDSEQPFIEKHAQIDRYNRKKNAWLNKQKRKLIKIANKNRITNLVDYFNYFEKNENRDDFNLEPFEMKTDIAYTKERKQKRWINKQKRISKNINLIFNKMKTNYIEQNIDTLKVKYNEVSRPILVSGSTNQDNDLLGGNYKEYNTREFIKLTLPGALFAAFFMFLIVPFSESSFIKDPSAWFKFISKTFLIAFAAFTMWNSNPELFRKTKQKALSERVNTLNQYYKKEKETQKKT